MRGDSDIEFTVENLWPMCALCERPISPSNDICQTPVRTELGLLCSDCFHCYVAVEATLRAVDRVTSRLGLSEMGT